jgi:hypothetical protein
VVKVSRRADPATPRAPGRSRARAAAWLVAGIVGVAVLAVASYRVHSALMRETGESGVAAVASGLVRAPVRIARAWATATPVPRLSLDVKFKDLHRLHAQRDEALRSGALDPSDDDFVPGVLGLDDGTSEVRLRFDGSDVEPLRGDKWPLFLHVRHGDRILGMRTFTLRAPEPPACRAEQALLAHARRRDLVTVRTALVDLTLNGRHLGLMEITEVPSPELLESQQRRDGPVLRFLGVPPLDRALPEETPIASVLRPDEIADSGRLSKQHAVASRLLRAAISGAVAPGDVFDPTLFGRFIALADLWDEPDVLAWHDVLLYANPLTARFEPVAHPCARTSGDDGPAASAASFRSWLLSDRAVRAAYEAEQPRLARDMATDSFASALTERLAARARVLHREHPLRAAFDPTPRLADAARGEPRPPEPPPPRVARGDALDSDLPLPSPDLDAVLARHPFLRWHPDERMLVARPGRWDVAGWLILPEGAGLRLEAGTALHFERRRGLIARGPLEFLGTADAPIVLDGPADPEQSPMWAGVYVIESERPSRWTHVTVRDTSGFRRRGWRLESGVVFRKTHVEIEDSTFRRSRGDDSLNIVRSSFVLRNVTIVDSEGDAFDGDYADGEIVDAVIGGAGGDAIDVGGSRLVVRGGRFENVRDKAIVVGEWSHATIEGVSIEHAGIGVASKNGSETTLRGSSIDDVTDVALTAYLNRPDYGPGVLVADGNRITRAPLSALAQSGSRITLDGQLVPTVDAAIDRLYKDGETDR